MIYFYSGTPGSGKSYHVAKDIYFQLNHGKNVIANFDINYDLITAKKKGFFFYKDNFDLTVDWLLDFSRLCHRRDKRGKIIEGQTWLVIDECQLIFNCRSWNDRSRQQWANFFTQHRKYGYNIILISQFDRLVDRQIRSLIEYEYRHRKINNFGTVGFFLGLFSLGHPFLFLLNIGMGSRKNAVLHFFTDARSTIACTIRTSCLTRAPRADRGGVAGAPERAGCPRQHQKPPYHVPVNRGLEIHGKFVFFLVNTRAGR